MAKTIEQLEGQTWEEPPEHESRVVITRYRLRKKPIDQFSVEDMRFMIGQNIGTQYLMPRALGLLGQNPLVEDYHSPGELLVSVVRLPDSYWEGHKDHLQRALRAAEKGLTELERRKAKRANKSAFLPGERPNGTNPIEEDVKEEIMAFISAHKAA